MRSGLLLEYIIMQMAGHTPGQQSSFASAVLWLIVVLALSLLQ